MHQGITTSIGFCDRDTQCMVLKSHQLWFSRLLDFLAYLKDQVLGWYLNVVLGFMEAYFLLALVPHKSQLIWCCGFLGEAFRWHWSKWSQTTNTNKGLTLSIANVWAGLPLSDLLLLTSWSLHTFHIYLSGLGSGSYWPAERFGYMNTLGHTGSLVQIIFTFWNWIRTSFSAIVFPLVHGQMPVSPPARKFEFTVGSPEPGPFPGAQPPIGLG